MSSIESQTKTCQNCKNDFTIESDDFLFYKKIKAPPPTFCLECRAKRRMVWRNERSLYKRKCSATGKNIISAFSENVIFPVYNNEYWWSDSWNSLDYGKEYDFYKSFFEQFKLLFNKVPQAAFFGSNLINCNYCNFFSDSKNCYLCFAGGQNENLFYCDSQVDSKDSIDLTSGNKNELCYENYSCSESYKTVSSYNSKNCLNSYFLSNCRNINNSVGSVNLFQKSNYIWNKLVSKDEYLKFLKETNFGSYKEFNKFKDKFINHILKYPVKYAQIINSFECSGDNLKNSNKSKFCFNGENLENCKYLTWTAGITKDTYDCVGIGMGVELAYEAVSSVYDLNLIRFVLQCQHGGNDLQYCIACYGSSHLFACIGLRSKQYCILNKQYTKEQYEELVPKIIKHMYDMPYIDSKGRVYKYGEFFPSELSPFCYNETIAQEYFPLTKKQALEQGYKWKDKEERNYNIDIYNIDIPDNINDVNDDILDKIIECNHKGTCNQQCTEAFKIIPEELQFYKRMNLPLPRLCPNCRHYERLAQRNPMKLWHRKCMHPDCTNEFETSYSPERPEIIYCEKCYNKEVY